MLMVMVKFIADNILSYVWLKNIDCAELGSTKAERRLQQKLSEANRRLTTPQSGTKCLRQRPDRAWAESNEVAGLGARSRWLKPSHRRLTTASGGGRAQRASLAKAKSPKVNEVAVLRFAERLRWLKPSAIRAGTSAESAQRVRSAPKVQAPSVHFVGLCLSLVHAGSVGVRPTRPFGPGLLRRVS